MNVEQSTFVFLTSWLLWLALLSAFAQTRLGYVLLYYSLCLMILFVMVTQYAQLAPYLTGIISGGQLESKLSAPAIVATNSGPNPT